MKIRSGFVSNSSSSSFICDISGNIECGYDVGLSECGMFECENGHTMYVGYRLDFDKEAVWKRQHENNIKSYQKDVDNEVWKQYAKSTSEWTRNRYNEDWEIDGEYPKEACPICMMEKFKDSDLLDFLLLEYDFTKEQVGKMMKESFTDYDSFRGVVDENKNGTCK